MEFQGLLYALTEMAAGMFALSGGPFVQYAIENNTFERYNNFIISLVSVQLLLVMVFSDGTF